MVCLKICILCNIHTVQIHTKMINDLIVSQLLKFVKDITSSRIVPSLRDDKMNIFPNAKHICIPMHKKCTGLLFSELKHIANDRERFRQVITIAFKKGKVS